MVIKPGCCGVSINQRIDSQPEFNKPFNPALAGNCSTCKGFGDISDIGALPENEMAKPVVVTARLRRGDF
jgi:hypothetical protein